MSPRIVCLVLLSSALLCAGRSYRPVFIVHGVLSGNISMLDMTKTIQEMHAGTVVSATDRFSGWSSLRPMWHQVQEIGKDFKEFMDRYPSGINLIGYSQGGLIARGLLQMFPNHNVKNFISLSSPQGGQYGTKFLHLFFPSLACEEAYELFYSIIGQHTSIGNYWNDPHHQKLFMEYSAFLPYINNLIPSNNSSDYKQALTRLNKMILIGGPDDEVITPWQSSQFGFYNENETVVELRDQGLYLNDSIGLKTLDKSGRLLLFSLDGNTHLDWHINATVLEKYILPYLD